jgi:6-phosphogluconolactonase
VAHVTVVSTEDELATEAADRLAAAVDAAVARHGNAIVCLTGGSTPRMLYERLARPDHPWAARVPWQRVHLFWGDERHVPPESPESNFGMANEALVQHVPVPRAHVHRMHGEYADPLQAAAEYDRALRQGFAAAGRPSLTFDLMLLGIGEDAHIASLFPGSPLLPSSGAATGGTGRAADDARVRAVYADHLRAWRITLTPDAVLDAHRILVLASGARKADALGAALRRPEQIDRWPAQLLRRAEDRVEWLIDRAAAAAL